MTRWTKIAWQLKFGAVLLGLVGLFLAGHAVSTTPAGGTEVDGDGGFLLVPGVTGAGTVDDPHVLRGVFDADGQPFGLRVRNTEAHFVIRDAVFAGATDAGLYLENVTNGWVVGCVFENNQAGVRTAGDIAQVTFTLNTFRNNVAHVVVVGAGTRAMWDDGRAGNWWDGYLGVDANGDGIGDVAWEVVQETEDVGSQFDRFPLVAPLAGVPVPEGAVLLQIRADVGERWVSEARLAMTADITIMGVHTPAQLSAQMLIEEVVTERHGAGSYFLVRVAVLEDSGSASFGGTPEEYVGDAGQVSWMHVFRFGGYEEMGEALVTTAGISIQALGWPVRWLHVGDTWTRTVESSAVVLGIPAGEARFRGVTVFERFEECDGRPLALLTTEGDFDVVGVEEDPVLGRMDFIMQGRFSVNALVDVASGRVVEQDVSIAFGGDIEASGEHIGIMELQMSVAARDLPPDEPADPTLADAPEALRLMEARLDELTEQVRALEGLVQSLQSKLAELAAPPALRIAVVDAEALFTRVFLPQVHAERAAMERKARDIQALQADYMAGKIKLDVYQQRHARLQAELIQASLRVNLAMLDKMIASPGFLNLRSDLQSVRTQAKPLQAEVQAAVDEAQDTIADLAGFWERLQQLEASFQQLDQLLTQVAAVKILEISQQVAKEKGYDLVLRTKDVVMFRREAAVSDLTPAVEVRLWGLFPVR